MKKLLSIGTLLFSWVMLQAQNRFPKPDFESGYQYPELHYAIPNETLWVVLDSIYVGTFDEYRGMGGI